MRRMVYRTREGEFKLCHNVSRKDAAKRLWEFESLNIYGALCRELDKARMVISELYDEVRSYRGMDVGIKASENGTTAERIAELVKADAEGRCLIRPVNTGDTVWVVTNERGCRGMGKEVVECRVRGIRLKSDGVTLLFTCEGRYEEGRGDWYVGNFTPNSIGRTVFMTREDAEAKLKGGK